jgi:hypothetical protein
MNLTELSFSKVKTQIESFLQQEYSKSGILYSNASPYGQILSVVENLYQLSFLYLKNSIKQYDLSNYNSLNSRIIRNAAIFAGHIPGRNISATGTLKFTLKTSADPSTDIPGSRITLINHQTLKNKTNGLFYSINLGTDKQSYKISTNSVFYANIIQGQWALTTFTGTGQENQTYQVALRGNQKDVEQFNYLVLVNGQYWTVKKGIYDMLPDEQACVIRTGFDGGIDVIFGNSGFGAIPPIGSIIQVNYLVSDGSVGSIFRRTLNDWTFVDPATDGFGNTIDLSKYFDVSIYTDINFGADKETTTFTKNVLPIVSTNFVLGLPQQYAYAIKRLGVFSYVNAYESYGTVYIVAAPNVLLFKNANSDYFTIDIRAFELDSYEISKIDLYLRTGGNILLSQRYQISSPTLSYYVMNVFVITYSDAQMDSVNAQIQDVVSNYFLNFTRLDRVPKSDLVQLISQINEIYSVDVSFISKKNEDYHINNITADVNRYNQYASKAALKLVRPNPTYSPKTSLGLDPILGDIIFEPSEIPVIRGGWSDRSGIYYSDHIDDSGLKSLNIINKGTIDANNRPQIQ